MIAEQGVDLLFAPQPYNTRVCGRKCGCLCAAHLLLSAVVHPQVVKLPSAHAEMCELILYKAKSGFRYSSVMHKL